MNHPITSTIRARATSPLKYNHVARLLARFPRDIRLRDGSELRLRELRSGDRELLKAFFDSCSPKAIYYRFLSPIRSLSDELLDTLTDADGSRHAALIMTWGERGDEMIVAEARYIVLKEQPEAADVAFLVADDMRRRGIATILMQELMEIASRNGVTCFSADILAENWAMLSLLRKTGLSGSGRINHGVIHFEIPIPCGEAHAMPEVA
jgi:GNAT superfamily N-acetyltransferase